MVLWSAVKFSKLMIREALEKDCINLAALSLEVWFSTYALNGIYSDASRFAIATFTEEKFQDILSESKYKLLVWVEDDYLRGYVLLNFESFYEDPSNGFEIDKLYVQSPFQGKGIGASLLSEVRIRYGEKFWLHSWVENKSIDFYKKYGFKDIGRYDFILGDEAFENRVLCFSG